MNCLDFLKKISRWGIKSKLLIESNSKSKIVQSFGFFDSNCNECLNFELLPTDIVNNSWKPIQLNNTELQNISSLLAEFTKSTTIIGISSQMTKGLYRASASPELLMKLNDGGIGSAVMNGNKIKGSAGFLEAGSTFFTPLIIFQAISFAVGQIYMQTISKQLNSIQKKLKELIVMYHIDREAIMEISYETFQKFSLKENFKKENFVEISGQLLELKKIRLEYKKMSEHSLNNIIFEENGFNSKKNANTIIDSFETSDFIYNIEKCLIANDLYRLGKLVEFNMKNKKRRLSIGDLDELKMENKDLFSLPILETYNNAKTKLFDNLNKHKTKTLINNKDIDTIIANQTNKFRLLEKDINYRNDGVNEKYNSILMSVEKSRDLILDIRNEIPKIYLN